VLTVRRLRLQLPAGFGPRAHGIARLLAEELATWQAVADRRIERLSVPVAIESGASDRAMAHAMAKAVASAAGLQKGGRE
jgi:hypothetical protein